MSGGRAGRSRWWQALQPVDFRAGGTASGLHLCSMAQIYPEDRGTNYAIREGRAIGRQFAAES